MIPYALYDLVEEIGFIAVSVIGAYGFTLSLMLAALAISQLRELYRRCRLSDPLSERTIQDFKFVINGLFLGGFSLSLLMTLPAMILTPNYGIVVRVGTSLGAIMCNILYLVYALGCLIPTLREMRTAAHEPLAHP